ncbi:MAG: ATP-dependent RecD-like DNA helicase [Saprospiraceae bacterium]
MDEIHGYIERITFQNADNGYTVARLKESGKKDLTTVVGTLTSVQAGESVRCKGFWKNDINYGFQFIVKEYEVERPSSEKGIKRYLSSGLIKGIGPAFAERIVDYYKLETLDVIDANPENLLEINGIGAKRVERIKSCWAEQKAIREVMVFLQSFGVSPTYAKKVFKTYGDKSIITVQTNPYQLARDIWGIGFKTADQTARQMGIQMAADIRIDSGVEYVLSELSNEGHTCYPVDKKKKKAQELLTVEANLIDARLAAILAEDRIVIASLEVAEKPTMCIWLKLFHVCERGIVKEWKRLHKGKSLLRKIAPDKAIMWAQDQLKIELAANQKTAVAQSLSEKIQIITGGPGTGKSTITKVILLITQQLTKKILLAAPTGRAAKRLSEITKMEASTIHSLLEFDFGINGFRKNLENPLDCDLLIVDEASMIDTVLMYSLLKAIPSHARLILVGDIDQLPSVGAGNVLQDLIASEKIPVTRLTDIFRQAADSKIIINAHKINAGQFPNIKTEPDADFFFIEKELPEQITELIPTLVKKRLPKKYGLDSFNDIQVLSPMNRGIIGTRNLNLILQKELNPSKDPLIKMGRTFHLHDKVMQLKNNYDKEVFNGDVGRIQKIDRIEQELYVDFEGKLVNYDFSDIDQLMLAYAVSVHKYQGSECPCIIMPMHTTHYMMLFRNMLYTGMTRGKRLVIIIGTKKALSMAIRNNKVAKRYSGLEEAFA